MEPTESTVRQWYFTQSGNLKWCDSKNEVHTANATGESIDAFGEMQMQMQMLYFDRKNDQMVMADGTKVTLSKTKVERSPFLKQQTQDWLVAWAQKFDSS